MQKARWIAEEALACGMNPADVYPVQNTVDAIAVLQGLLRPGDVVLIKGSRAAGMETSWTRSRARNPTHGGKHESHRTDAVCAGLATVAFLLAVIWGRPLLGLAQAQEDRQTDPHRRAGPHQTKMGTPTMGGVLFIVPVFIITDGAEPGESAERLCVGQADPGGLQLCRGQHADRQVASWRRCW